MLSKFIVVRALNRVKMSREDQSENHEHLEKFTET